MHGNGKMKMRIKCFLDLLLQGTNNSSLDSNFKRRREKMIGKAYAEKLNIRFNEGKLETGYCDIVTLADERARNREHKL